MDTAVIDCHVHVGSEEAWIPDGLRLAQELADEQVREVLTSTQDPGPTVADYLRRQGVTAAIAIPVGRAPVQEYTLRDAERTDGFLRPLVQYDPRSAPDAARRFDRAITAGAVGLKVHPMSHQLPVNDRSLYPLYTVAAERGVPVVMHVGSSVFPGAKLRFCDPLLVDEVAADFPELKVVCAHAGRGFWTEQVFQLTRMRDNVWMELSGLPANRIVEAFPELDRVANRVVFGSDWPSSPAVGRLVDQFRQMPFAKATLTAALSSNAVRLFGLDDLANDGESNDLGEETKHGG